MVNRQMSEELSMESAVRNWDAIEDQIRQLKSKTLSVVAVGRALDRLESLLAYGHAGTDQDYQRIENCAILMWNLTVVRKSSNLPAKLDARMRQIACDIMNMVDKVDTNTDTHHKRKYQMTMKSAKAWLVCGEANLANKLIQHSMESLSWLRGFSERQCTRGLVTETEVQAVHEKLDEENMKCHLYTAEALCILEQFEVANEHLDRAESMLDRHPKAACIVSILCYNLGVASYHKRQYLQSTAFLRRALHCATDVDAVQQGRMLRLLCNCYLDEDENKYAEQALQAVDKANKISLHPSGLYLRLRILLLLPSTDQHTLSDAVQTLIENKETTSDVAFRAAELLIKHEKSPLAVKVLRRLLDRFPQCPELARAHSTHVAVLVQWREYEQAEQVIVEFLKACDKPTSEQDKEAFGELTKLTKTVADEFIEKEDPVSALRWFDYCLTFRPDSDSESDVEMAKLHRDRASCLLSTGQVDEAWSALTLAERHEPAAVSNQYLKLRVALARAKDGAASDALLKMCQLLDGTPGEKTSGLISLAAQFALEPSCRESVIQALRKLASTSENPGHVISALRCLTRLHNTTRAAGRDKDGEHISAALETIQQAYTHLKSESEKCRGLDDKHGDTFQFLEELDWFTKTAWNLAIQCEERVLEMFELYSLCYKPDPFTNNGGVAIFAFVHTKKKKNNNKLSCMRAELSQEWLVRRQTCSFMAGAAALDLAKRERRPEEKRSWLERSLESVGQCRAIQQKLKAYPDCPRSPETSVGELLLLLEFEAKAWQRNPDMERTFLQAIQAKNLDPRTLEKMAVVCHEARCADKSLYPRILNAAIERHSRQSPPDYTQISKLFLFLIEGSLSDRLPGNKSRDAAWKHYQQILEMLETRAEDFPERDVVSFMARAWNVGVDMMSHENWSEAEKWCSLGLKLLQFVREEKSIHEPKMNEMYAELLSRLNT